MTRSLGALLATMFLLGPALSARAADQDASAVLDKAIKAMGGEEKLSKIVAYTTKTESKVTVNDSENDLTVSATVQGLDHYRAEIAGVFNGNAFEGVSVLAGDKGWRHFGDNFMDLDADAIANEKRSIYLQAVPTLLVPLKDKSKGFKMVSATDSTVDGKPAVAMKITGPDNKDFTLTFDKDSGLPVKMEAHVVGFGGQEFDQETNFFDYKDYDGIKKATRVESKRDGQAFLKSKLTEFKAFEKKLDASTFAEPK